jgi:hypothetical protein
LRGPRPQALLLHEMGKPCLQGTYSFFSPLPRLKWLAFSFLLTKI